RTAPRIQTRSQGCFGCERCPCCLFMTLFFANFIDDRSNINAPKPKEPDPMTTAKQPEPVFLQTVSVALGQLKQRLQQDYERAYPDLREIIHLVLDDEEANAWELSLFPHLLLPDLVEA